MKYKQGTGDRGAIVSRDDIKKIKKEAMKKKIGLRFKEFRKAIKKYQYELADEMNVHISTIANIETGKAYLPCHIQYYLHHQYNLNINWLFDDSEEMILPPAYADCPLIFRNISKSDPRFEKYLELIRLMRFPLVEQIILGKLTATKLIAKEEINSFFEET